MPAALRPIADLCGNLTNRLADLRLQPAEPERVPMFSPSLALPQFTGYHDAKSVADFLGELEVYKATSGASELFLLTRVLPVALGGSTACWWRLQD